MLPDASDKISSSGTGVRAACSISATISSAVLSLTLQWGQFELLKIKLLAKIATN